MLHVELVGYVCGELGVEKVNAEQALPSAKRVGLVHFFTASRLSQEDDSEERLVSSVPGGKDWSRTRCRANGSAECFASGLARKSAEATERAF